MSIKIHLAHPNDLETYKTDLLEIYREAFQGAPYSKSKGEMDDFYRYLPIHAAQPGFRLVIAVEVPTEKIIGFCYGREVTAQLPWYEIVHPPLRSAGLDEWLEDAYQVTEMAVIPVKQGQGVGGRLHDTLLEGLSHRRAVLTTMATYSAAHQLYRRKGWTILLDELVVPGYPRSYCVMGLDLTEVENGGKQAGQN